MVVHHGSFPDPRGPHRVGVYRRSWHRHCHRGGLRRFVIGRSLVVPFSNGCKPLSFRRPSLRAVVVSQIRVPNRRKTDVSRGARRSGQASTQRASSTRYRPRAARTPQSRPSSLLIIASPETGRVTLGRDYKSVATLTSCRRLSADQLKPSAPAPWAVLSRRQRLDRYREWPVFSCRSMAGFGCPAHSRFPTAEGFITTFAPHLLVVGVVVQKETGGQIR